MADVRRHFEREELPAAASAPRGLRYLLRNIARRIWARRAGRWVMCSLVPITVAATYLLRSLLYPAVIALRPVAPVLVAASVTAAILTLVAVFRGRRTAFWITATVMGGVWAGGLVLPINCFRELSLWHGYRRLEKIELTELPLTGRERIYPLSMVKGIVTDRSTGSHYRFDNFELIEYDGALYWSAPETPVGVVDRLTLRDIEGLVRIGASQTEIDVQRFSVDFAHGRNLALVRDLLRYTLPNRLGFFDYFDKEIDDDITYVQVDAHRFVQVVAVIDWDGVFPFAIPTFGGVFVASPGGDGDIRFLRPEEISTVPYLAGQNLLPEKVSRFYAESWKLNQGLWGWARNRGRTEITQIPEDTNPQPFTVYFRDVGERDGLYQFYALEPEGQGTGLSKILLFEPYGRRRHCRVYYYDFDSHGQALVGPARIAETIRGSDRHAQWKQKSGGTFLISESRPFVKESGGKRIFRWFNSIVTSEQGSSLPLIVIADPDTLEVEWYEGDAVSRLLEP